MTKYSFFVLIFTSLAAFSQPESPPPLRKLKGLDEALKQLTSEEETLACEEEAEESKYRYPQCIEVISTAGLLPECQKINKNKACIEAGKKRLEQEDQSAVSVTMIAETEKLDPDGVRECLYYLDTKIIKRPHPDHLLAIARKKDKIKQIAGLVGVPPEAIACAIGADATLTKARWISQAHLYNSMLQDLPAQRALNYLKGAGVKVPPPGVWRSEDGVIIKTAAIMKEAELLYKASGYDIAGRSEILATLYNIGGRKADGSSRAVNRGPTYRPQANFFGLYCQRYLSTYQEILK